MGRQKHEEVLTVDNTTLGEALRQVTGPLKDLHEKLSGEDGLTWLEELKKFLRKEKTWDLLEQVTTFTVPAISAFDAAAHFRVTPEKERKSTEVPIGWMNDNAHLLKGRTEPEVAETVVRVLRLLRPCVDGPIIAYLGGEQVVTTTWGQMYEMMRRQGRGQEGDLLVNGSANIFYIPDIEGQLWAVYCSWDSGYRFWDVGAYPISNPYTWFAGCQVFSR
jgi:hypothetical protein